MKTSRNKMKSFSALLGSAMVAASSLAAAAVDGDSLFTSVELKGGYLLAAKADTEGKCGEGKCGGDAKGEAEGKCGEGKCGGDTKDAAEGKCGEGKCGGDAKGEAEGKCGEGKCGAGA